MRNWPTHDEHGEPGFVTCRRGIIEGLLDDLDAAEEQLTHWYQADGSVVKLAPYEVTAKRIAAAKRIAQLEADVVSLQARARELRKTLHDLRASAVVCLGDGAEALTAVALEEGCEIAAEVLARTEDL